MTSIANGKTVLVSSELIHAPLIEEIYRRGGAVEILDGTMPGKDRDIYDIVAEKVGVTEAQRRLRIIDIWPTILSESKNQTALQHAQRLAWDYTMLVAVQHLKQPRPVAYLRKGTRRGVWELTDAGKQQGQQLIASE